MNIVARRKTEIINSFRNIIDQLKFDNDDLASGNLAGVKVTADTRAVLMQEEEFTEHPFLARAESVDNEAPRHAIIGNYVHVDDNAELPKGDKGLALTFQAPARSLIACVSKLKEIGYTMLLSVTAVDYHEVEEERFEVVYHLRNMQNYSLLRIVVATELEVPSLCALYHSANFMERETYDMYGIKFTDHPDLRRILMYDEFAGYPLRKDYPLQKKQPRIPLLKPEDENTARMMKRPDLITINKKNKKTEQTTGKELASDVSSIV